MKWAKNIWVKSLGTAVLAAVLLATGCGQTPAATPQESAQATDTVTKTMELKYSKGFKVEYLEEGIKKLTDAENRTIMLVAEGQTVPEQYRDEVVIETPVKNAMLASTTQGCMVRALGEVASIKAVTADQKTWKIPEFTQGLDKGDMVYVGESKAPDYEKIQAISPSVVFVYSGDSGLQSMMAKLDELSIPYVVCNEYLEEDPRGRMEWLKCYSAFFDKEKEADVFFNASMEKIDAVVEKAKSEPKPKVAWGIVYNGKVYIAEKGSYAAKMIEMAGGDYIFKDTEAPGGNITLETFFAQAKEADVLIYSSMQNYTPDIQAVIDQAPVLESIKPIQDKKVWCFHPDYYQSLDKTEEIIEDLYAIFHNGGETKHFVKY